MSYAYLLQALSVQARTYRELAEITGLHHHTVRDYVNALHKVRVVCIAGWTERGYRQGASALFALNSSLQARDAHKPPPLTRAERTARYKRRQKRLANGHGHSDSHAA